MARISKRTPDAQKPPAKGKRIFWDDELRVAYSAGVKLLRLEQGRTPLYAQFAPP